MANIDVTLDDGEVINLTPEQYEVAFGETAHESAYRVLEELLSLAAHTNVVESGKVIDACLDIRKGLDALKYAAEAAIEMWLLAIKKENNG